MLPSHKLERVLRDVARERGRQDELVRSNRVPFNCADPHVMSESKLAVLAEEFGEVARAHLEDQNLYEELIQTAAVAVAWAESLVEEDAVPYAPPIHNGAAGRVETCKCLSDEDWSLDCPVHSHPGVSFGGSE